MRKTFVACALMMASLASFAKDDDRIVSVLGQCQKKVTPDRGSIQLVAEFIEKNASQASQKTQSLYEALRAEVKKLNLKDLEIQTSHYSVDEEISWENNKKNLKGFRASMGMQVITSEIPRLGEVIQKTSSLAGARGNGLQVFVSPKKMQDERESCLAEAIKNARSKADRMSEAAGAKVGKVFSIEETGSQSIPSPIAFRAQLSGEAEKVSQESMVIDSKQEDLSVSVQVRYFLQ